MRKNDPFRFLKIFSIILSAVFPRFGAAEDVVIGKYKSRAIWTSTASQGEKTPVVILLTGSGAHGPEEMMPSSVTADGKDHPLLSEISTAINKAGVSTLALGKPGVEFFSTWDMSKWFYDANLYQALHWQDLVDNLEEAVKYVRSLSTVDGSRIFVLGHSEGTQIAVDYASADSDIAGVLLLGYAGEDIATTVDWQLFKRGIENFVQTDVDRNQDGYVSKSEAEKWPEFVWDWQSGVDRISYQDIESAMRKDVKLASLLDKLKNSPLYDQGVFNRGPIYQKTAQLKQPVYVFTGELDQQTSPKEALALKDACEQAQKTNCFVTLVPGVGHGFSSPRKPRSHPLLDMTLGPIEETFQNTLTRLASQFLETNKEKSEAEFKNN